MLNAECFPCKSSLFFRSKGNPKVQVLLDVVRDGGFPVTIGACACVGDGPAVAIVVFAAAAWAADEPQNLALLPCPRGGTRSRVQSLKGGSEESPKLRFQKP